MIENILKAAKPKKMVGAMQGVGSCFVLFAQGKYFHMTVLDVKPYGSVQGLLVFFSCAVLRSSKESQLICVCYLRAGAMNLEH
jgi:hypothetical protein